MEAVTVTIGRNVGSDPMGPADWQRYVTHTRAALLDVVSDLWIDTPYTGEWEGRTEDAWAFYGPVEHTDQLDALRGELGGLAALYGQDAVGLAVGSTELVSAPVPV